MSNYSNRRHHQHNHRPQRNQRNISDPINSINHTHQTGSNCSLTICYSYLIAILSSFLVVLGIYLSLTKFNARFLYISCAGLLIEAISACIYCMSNIHKSKLARQKQAHEQRIDNVGSSQVQRRQQNAALTHILSNRALNQTAINSIQSTTTTATTAQTNEQRGNRTLARAEEQNVLGGSESDCATATTTTTQTDQPDRAIEINSPIEFTSLQQTSSSEHSAIVIAEQNLTEELPKNQSCHELPIATSDDARASQQQQQNNTSINILGLHRSSELITNDSNNLDSDESIQNKSSLVNDGGELPKTSLATVVTCNAGSNDPTSGETDLINLQQQQPAEVQAVRSRASNQQQPLAATSNEFCVTNENDSHTTAEQQESPSTPPISQRQRANQRPAHFRRTLVMGLSGEEEVIEIDEEDLDNMSILPPSYESIATNTKPSQ